MDLSDDPPLGGYLDESLEGLHHHLLVAGGRNRKPLSPCCTVRRPSWSTSGSWPLGHGTPCVVRLTPIPPVADSC